MSAAPPPPSPRKRADLAADLGADYTAPEFRYDEEEDAEPPIPLELVLKPQRIAPVWVYAGLLALLVVLGGLILRGQLANRADAGAAGGAPEDQARATLRRVGAAQQAYLGSSTRFGTFEELRVTGRLPAEFSRAASIAEYSLAYWSTRDPVWVDSGIDPASLAPGEVYHSQILRVPPRFTIVALPTGSFAGLRTFAMCDDGQIRMAPASGVALASACDWPLTDTR